MLKRLIPHAVIIISAMYAVFFFIDRVNASMAFINNPITKGLMLLFCVLASFDAVRLIRSDRRRTRILEQRRQKARDKAPQSQK